MITDKLMYDVMGAALKAFYNDPTTVAEDLRRAIEAVAPMLIEPYRKALEEIANHPHNDYSNEPGITDAMSQYKMGVTDGHRCAATIARAALSRAQELDPE